MRTVLLSLSLFCAATFSGMAMKVKGVVKDDSGTLPGASVTIKGTLQGTESDDDGSFEIEADPGATLVVEFLGYEKREVKVPSSLKKPLTINLSEDLQTLKAVEVVAQPYGGTGGSTSSTTTLSAESLKANTSASIDNALQGKVAGVQATSTSGQPGAPANIRIHGQSSLTGSGDPLYVVDGMPLGGGTDKTASSNPLASINPADIESMEVLKDASATAIYGSRAANGVIIIKTKKGKKGDAKISYNGNFTVSQFTNRYDMMNLQEYAQYLNDMYTCEYGAKDPETLMANPSILGKGTDWQDELFQTAIGHSHQLSVNGGSENTQYNMSLGYMNQEGVMITSDFERINGRMNIESQVKKWLRMGMNLGISRQNSHKIANIVDPKALQSGASCVGKPEVDEVIIVQTLIQLPSDSPYDLNGQVSGPETDQGVKMNPIAELHNSPLIRHETNILGSTFLEFKIAKDITWRNEFGIDMTNADDSYYKPSFRYGALYNSTENAESKQGNYSNSSMRFSSYANWTKTLAKRHRLNAMLGAEASQFAWEGLIYSYKGFSSNAVHTPNLSSEKNFESFYKGEGSMASWFGRVNYSFDNRYDFSATGRYDGSSNFASGNQWGFFPSVSAAWRINQEKFIAQNENLNKVINNLKLRVGYGETGNSSCSPAHIAYVSMWNTKNSNYDVFHYNNYTNPDLSWETNKQFNIGLNLGLWNRIDLSFDWFHKKNEDLLLKPELPSFIAPSDWTSLSTAYVNAGSIKNVGFDIALNTTNIVDTLLGQPFTWSSDISFSVVRNEVVDLGSSTEAITEASDPTGSYRMNNNDMQINRSIKGEAPGKFYGYKVLGVIMDEQDLWRYQNVINPEGGKSAKIGDLMLSSEKEFIGDPNPDFTWGFGNTVNWGPWAIGIQLTGSHGNDVYNLIRQKIESNNGYVKWNNQSKDVLDFARVVTDNNGTHVVNNNTSIPRYEPTNTSGTQEVTDRFVEDGSFVKIQNISVTYTLPTKYCEKMKIDNLHVSAGCSNVYTFTGYSGYDPENPGSAIRQGVDEGRYPSPRTYSVGLGFNF